jgi:hypothetical protein
MVNTGTTAGCGLDAAGVTDRVHCSSTLLMLMIELPGFITRPHAWAIQ